MNLLRYNKKNLIKSVLISATLHFAVVLVLFSTPLHIHPPSFFQIRRTPSIFQEKEHIIVSKRNRALEEAFSYLEPIPFQPLFHPSEIAKILRAEKRPSFELTPSAPTLPLNVFSLPDFSVESMPPPCAHSLKPTRIINTPLSTHEIFSNWTPFVPNASISQIENHDLNDCSKYDIPLTMTLRVPEASYASFDALLIKEEEQAKSLSSLEIPTSEVADRLVPSLGTSVVFAALPKKNPMPTMPVSELNITPTQPSLVMSKNRAALLGDYGFPSVDLKEWSEFFDMDVKTHSQEEGGVLFSISLIPKQDLSDYRLKQNFLFMIDRSNSVDKYRYQAFKRAVIRAIHTLKEDDYFNVMLLDSSITYLSDKPLAVSKSNRQKAEEFLEHQQHGHYRAATDIYSTLIKILGPIEYSEEAMTAILISDGDSQLKADQQRKKINSWLKANKDRVTLYTATAGEENNLSSLKMLGLSSRGSLVYSDTHAALPRKLAKWVIDLRSPIAKEVTVSLIPSDPSAHIDMLPPASRLPYLLGNSPFMLMGCCDKITDFTLILEGKNKGRVLTIKKEISLSNAKTGSRRLINHWMSEKAHAYFDQYLQEGKLSVLEKAQHNDNQNYRR